MKYDTVFLVFFMPRTVFFLKKTVFGIKVIPVRLSVCKRTFVYMYLCMYNMNIPDFSNF